MFAPSPVHPAHHSLVPRWVVHLGPVGLFLVAIVDSSVVPLPIPGTTDLLLLLFVVQGGNPWLLTSGAIVGSIIGGYTSWQLGKKGGEAAMHRYVAKRRRARISAWMQRHPILAVFLPAVLPPPIPLSPFLLASGALGVSRNRFLIVFSVARTLRYSLITWLGATYGRTVVHLWTRTQHKWATPLLWSFGGVVVVCVIYSLWRLRTHRNAEAAERRTPEPASARGD